MKKKMVTMLMIGTMAVMTACGTASKNDTVSDTTTVETDGNVKEDKSENDTKKDDAEVVSVDDVYFNGRDTIVKGGSTYNIKEEISCISDSSSIKEIKNMTFEIPEGLVFHIKGDYQEYRNDNLEENNTFDNYYNREDNSIYEFDSTMTSPIKYIDEHQSMGSGYLESIWSKIFNLSWTLKSETNNEFIFGLENNDDFSNITDQSIMAVNENDEISNLVSSYIYDKNKMALSSIELSFDINHTDSYGTNFLNHYKFKLESSNIGNTTVEIPEDIINNAVEE